MYFEKKVKNYNLQYFNFLSMPNFFFFFKLHKKSFSAKVEKKFLVTGCCGQIGSALVPRLYHMYGLENITCTDVANQPSHVKGKFHSLDVSDDKTFRDVALSFRPTNIVHLAAILSGKNSN